MDEKCITGSSGLICVGLTLFDGENVMCVLILEGGTPDGSIAAGIDIKNHPDCTTTDSDFIIKNSGNRKHFPDVPEFLYHGKTVLALVGWHESTNITSDILIGMLQTWDGIHLIPCKPTAKPLILLDGHRNTMKAKDKLFALKDTLGLQNDRIIDTKLMQMINKAWNKSFVRVEKNGMIFLPVTGILYINVCC